MEKMGRHPDFQSEVQHLDHTISLVKGQLKEQEEKSLKQKESIQNTKQELYSQTIFASDFDQSVSLAQYLQPLQTESSLLSGRQSTIAILSKMLDAPYFARVDFEEKGGNLEKIYIGLSNLMDQQFHIYVYDWRSPVASLFYQFETGAAHYQAPMGVVEGEICKKRQFEIKKGTLCYFFDADIQVSDEFLREQLAQNAAPAIKAIVETIQKNQDSIIRDVKHDLLMVQGVAGSGKTSVALHRAAFLMYQGAKQNLRHSQILIISPNDKFSRYISRVLPELGENNVLTETFDSLAEQCLGEKSPFISREAFYDQILFQKTPETSATLDRYTFKASEKFMRILDRWLAHYERSQIPFTDVYYNNQLLFHRYELKNRLNHLRRISESPLNQLLLKIETEVFERVHQVRKNRLAQIEQFLGRYPSLQFEIEGFARYLSILESGRLLHQVRQFTRPNIYSIYQLFLAENGFCPDGFTELGSSGSILYEDAAPLVYLAQKIYGSSVEGDIRQVIIDEAQDYGPIHFAIFKRLFPQAKFTVLGDLHQSLLEEKPLSFYEDIARQMAFKNTQMMILNKSFRTTKEIFAFSRQFCAEVVPMECFSRNGKEPDTKSFPTTSSMIEFIRTEWQAASTGGLGSGAVIVKSRREADLLFTQAGFKTDNLQVLPVYEAKGLEFDVVFLCLESGGKMDEITRKVVYAGATRALHQLYFLQYEKEGAHD